MLTHALPDRVREQEAPHIRHVDIQTLDALLRIEELLQKMAADNTTAATPFTIDTDEDIKEALKKPGGVIPVKKKNSRQL